MIDKDNRIKLLEKIIENLNNWDGNIESAIDLAEKNNEILEEIRQNNTIENVDSSLYEKKLIEAIEQLRDFISSLNSSRDLLLEENKQLNLKDKVLKNYITQVDDTVFIDKDIL
ncbi:hypothetical protein E8P77_08475 [Soehngenia saccharolytica]|nr:hypothetical protein E8P77_08475 [Soehngenia saccharolytica]